jgi:crotonobetainyl-CoA:carnitine CoA-transferase CaiB-like acyl-CoA transferase
MGALTGIRVLDFSRVLAGPFCTMLLADLGAEVIKVENPAGGDDTRQWGPPWAGELSAYFIAVNRNKRSLTLNLKNTAARQIARDLAAKSDILIENFKPGQMAEFGLGYSDLRPLNPGLVYCSITGFGQTGPYHERPGYDFAIQAMSGLMSITGESDGAPMKVGVAVSDLFTGLYAATSILAALHHREKTGEGQYIDLALLDSQIAALVNIASNYLVSGDVPVRVGNEHPNIVPYQTFRAADREFIVAVGNDRQFRALCQLVGRPEMADDPRYSTNPRRVANRALLVSELQTVFLTRPSEVWVEGLLAAGIPTGPIYDVPTALNDPQVAARGLLHTVTDTRGEMLRLVGFPAQFSATPAEIHAPPPALGQHTDQVLQDVLGMDAERVAACRADGAI